MIVTLGKNSRASFYAILAKYLRSANTALCFCCRVGGLGLLAASITDTAARLYSKLSVIAVVEVAASLVAAFVLLSVRAALCRLHGCLWLRR